MFKSMNSYILYLKSSFCAQVFKIIVFHANSWKIRVLVVFLVQGREFYEIWCVLDVCFIRNRDFSEKMMHFGDVFHARSWFFCINDTFWWYFSRKTAMGGNAKMYKRHEKTRFWNQIMVINRTFFGWVLTSLVSL